MPGDPGATVVTTLVCYQYTAHEAAGATGTRHSPRPRSGGRFLNDSGASHRGIVDPHLKVLGDLISSLLWHFPFAQKPIMVPASLQLAN
jgi:hypothetical protein